MVSVMVLCINYDMLIYIHHMEDLKYAILVRSEDIFVSYVIYTIYMFIAYS